MNRRIRLCPLIIATAAIVVLGGCGGGSQTARSTTARPPAQRTSSATTTASPPSAAGPSGTVSSSAGGVTATMRAAGHNPKVDRPWPVSFTVTRAGHRVKAGVTYQYLFAGQVVARRSHYTFNGRFADVFHWPSSAVGYPLTFRAVISVGHLRINLDYPVQVTR